MDHTNRGYIIKDMRLQRNLTQAQLAEMLGVSSAYIAQIERGMAFSHGRLEELAGLMGFRVDVSVEDLGVTS